MKLYSQVCSVIGELPAIVKLILITFLGDSCRSCRLFLLLPERSERFRLIFTGFSTVLTAVGFWTTDRSVSSKV